MSQLRLHRYLFFSCDSNAKAVAMRALVLNSVICNNCNRGKYSYHHNHNKELDDSKTAFVLIHTAYCNNNVYKA